MKTIEAYPLAWPDGWPRRRSWERSVSKYEVPLAKARDDLLRELSIGGGRDVVISTNLPLRRDGAPLASTREPEDPGVAVYWTDRTSTPRVIACDVWRTVRENVRAVGLAYASLRQIERTGASELLERAFSGFARLPSGAPKHWTEILGLSSDATRVQINARYRELASIHHPDRGGDGALMAEINRAYTEAVGESPRQRA